jgi:hypothetical protein
VSENDANPNSIAPPSATGPAGPRFEGKVGAFYLLALLGSSEPRGLPGARVKSVRFQQAAHGRPLDDMTVEAVNADGSPAFLDIQAKRTIDFISSNAEFADVVRRLLASSQKPEFRTSRYELAVAIARTSTRIERHCQEVLHWARQLTTAASFAAHMQLQGFSSAGMRTFLVSFRQLVTQAGGNADEETVWTLLRHFQILVFDFESVGSDYDHRARERARTVLAPDQADRAADLWSVLADVALARAAAGGDLDHSTLARELGQIHGFRVGQSPDLRVALVRLAESSCDALADIKDSIGGVRLSREAVVEECYQALEFGTAVQIVASAGVGKSAVLKQLAMRTQEQGVNIVLAPGRIIGNGWVRMAAVIDCPVSRNELFNELACGGGATLFIDNIDQIDDAHDWLTLRDLLRGTLECPGLADGRDGPV